MPKKKSKKRSLVFKDIARARRYYKDKKVSFRDAAGVLLIGWVRDIKDENGVITLIVRDVPERMTRTFKLPADRSKVWVIGR